ncbi:MAG: DUF1638 domain-containing protein [Lentisphaerae bacterium]|nr:DUF1638 domain-containing protein [Lentisphaerota bacterium]
MTKHFKVIGCNVLRREIFACAARSPHLLEVALLRQGLHDQPERLRQALQAAIDALQVIEPRARGPSDQVPADRPYDAILLGYALCCNGTAGLVARQCPLVIPRAHDCLTLLLGERERYQEYFDRHPGTYWYSSGWIETCLMPGKARYEETRAHYAAQYGEDNAQYLMEVQEEWYRKYSRAVYVGWGFPNQAEEQAFTRRCAAELKWEYDELQGHPGMLQRLLDGEWRADEFLVVQPGEQSLADPTGPLILKAGGND